MCAIYFEWSSIEIDAQNFLIQLDLSHLLVKSSIKKNAIKFRVFIQHSEQEHESGQPEKKTHPSNT